MNAILDFRLRGLEETFLAFLATKVALNTEYTAIYLGWKLKKVGQRKRLEEVLGNRRI